MARYTGPRVRISRRFGVPIFGASKYLERKNYAPGMHGPKARRKLTDYALGLIEKQKLRYYYGLLERQFRGVYEKALRRRGVGPEVLVGLCVERSLDLVVSLLASLGSRRIETLADLHRDFQSASASTVNYKPFYEKLDKPGFSRVMKATRSRSLASVSTTEAWEMPREASWTRLLTMSGKSRLFGRRTRRPGPPARPRREYSE